MFGAQSTWFEPTTVDGINPTPPGMYTTLQIMGYLPYQLVNAGFLPSTVFHLQLYTSNFSLEYLGIQQCTVH